MNRINATIDAISRLAGTQPVAVDPHIADAMGAQLDEALSGEDAIDSLFVEGE